MNRNRFTCNHHDPASVADCVSNIFPRISEKSVWIAPTNTLYGISGNGLNNEVIERIKKIKSRDQSRFILLARDLDQVRSLADYRSMALGKMHDLFLEGCLTLILNKKDRPDKIAFRIASDGFSRQLLAKLGFPIISTSANISGKPYEDNPANIYFNFAAMIDFMVDAGPLGSSEPSTIVDATHESPVIVRKGAHAERINSV